MMSMLQQRQLIEASFVPYICKCMISSDGFVSIKVSDPLTEAEVLKLDGISSSELMSWRSISAFVEGLQRDLGKLTSTAADEAGYASASGKTQSPD